jgi:crotonobetainyl-CoA:carnitine CoA-transferase CaiB-like acyl-CoA transferase
LHAATALPPGQSSYFVWLKRGKKSIEIDLATLGGTRTLEKLVAGADVLVQNLKPGVMDRLGFSSERLKADYPSLIYCTISGDGAMGRIPVERHTTFSCGPKAGWRPLRAVPKHLLASGCRSLTSQPARQPMRQFSKPS